jgi:NADH:ubiquinone oxidoreductase subunit 5 (subunit L)/multisubunit Na+/H+ antiporter MnhA subunit
MTRRSKSCAGSHPARLQSSWALRIDALTSVMLVVVNTVSALVHLYSLGYMSHDEHQPRFFAYLSLFTFAMLMLVTSDNLIQMFFGWEGVGLASYLLIGFWYTRPSANAAAIKAFVVNRVGDFGFALGIFGCLHGLRLGRVRRHLRRGTRRRSARPSTSCHGTSTC